MCLVLISTVTFNIKLDDHSHILFPVDDLLYRCPYNQWLARPFRARSQLFQMVDGCTCQNQCKHVLRLKSRSPNSVIIYLVYVEHLCLKHIPSKCQTLVDDSLYCGRLKKCSKTSDELDLC